MIRRRQCKIISNGNRQFSFKLVTRIAPFSRCLKWFRQLTSRFRDWPQISASANNLRTTNVVENTPTMVRTTRWDASLLKIYGTGGRYLWHLYLHNNILKIDSDVKDQLYKLVPNSLLLLLTIDKYTTSLSAISTCDSYRQYQFFCEMYWLRFALHVRDLTWAH